MDEFLISGKCRTWFLPPRKQNLSNCSVLCALQPFICDLCSFGVKSSVKNAEKVSFRLHCQSNLVHRNVDSCSDLGTYKKRSTRLPIFCRLNGNFLLCVCAQVVWVKEWNEAECKHIKHLIWSNQICCYQSKTIIWINWVKFLLLFVSITKFGSHGSHNRQRASVNRDHVGRVLVIQ